VICRTKGAAQPDVSHSLTKLRVRVICPVKTALYALWSLIVAVVLPHVSLSIRVWSKALSTASRAQSCPTLVCIREPCSMRFAVNRVFLLMLHLHAPSLGCPVVHRARTRVVEMQVAVICWQVCHPPWSMWGWWDICVQYQRCHVFRHSGGMHGVHADAAYSCSVRSRVLPSWCRRRGGGYDHALVFSLTFD